MGRNLNRQVFYEDEYEAINNYGLNKGKVARIVHSTKKLKSKKTAQEVSVDLDALSRKELVDRANLMGLATNSKMSKRDLISALRNFK